MKTFSQRVEEELKKLAFESDENTEGFEKPVKEKMADQNVQTPGGAPGPRSPEDMKQNPEQILNDEAVKEMSAISKFAFDPKKGKEWWDSVTDGETHKITACIRAAESFADDPGAFCGALAKEVGYEPPR